MDINTIECQRCKKNIEVIAPEMEVVQTVDVSMLMWYHKEKQSCPFCGLVFSMRLVSIGEVKISWYPIDQSKVKTIAKDLAKGNVIL